MALPEPPQASRPLEARSRSLSQICGGRWPTSLVERGAEEALPPRPTERGLQGGRAARLCRSQRDPLARSLATPARIPPPAPPVSPTGRGHGEALTPPGTRESRSRRGPNSPHGTERPLRQDRRGALKNPPRVISRQPRSSWFGPRTVLFCPLWVTPAEPAVDETGSRRARSTCRRFTRAEIQSVSVMVVRACGCGSPPRTLITGRYAERPSPESSLLAVSGERAEAPRSRPERPALSKSGGGPARACGPPGSGAPLEPHSLGVVLEYALPLAWARGLVQVPFPQDHHPSGHSCVNTALHPQKQALRHRRRARKAAAHLRPGALRRCARPCPALVAFASGRRCCPVGMRTRWRGGSGWLPRE